MKKLAWLGREWVIEIALFFLLFGCYVYTLPRWADWNQNSRLDVVLAVVDQGTLSIDAYHENTGDYALYKGHYYGEKAPGTSFLGIPVYAVFRFLLGRPLSETVLPALAQNSAVASTLQEGGTGLLTDKLYFALAMYVVTIFTVALPSAILGVVFYRSLGNFSRSVTHKLLLTIVYGLGTMAFPYSGNYYGHQVTAILLFIAFVLLFKGRQRGIRAGSLLLVGLLSGFSVITEYPTIFAAGALFLYALYFLQPKVKVWPIIVGAIPSVLALGVYNTIAFDKPWQFSYKYSELWLDLHHTGFFGTTTPTFTALWGITLSPYRGLFFLSPFLLLAIPGFYLLWRKQAHRPELVMSGAIVFILTLFNAASRMWSGGYSVGPRYLIPMLPFLTWPIISFLDRYEGKLWARVLVAGLAVISIGFVWMQTISGQSFPDYTRTPLWDYSWPRFIAGDIARNLGTVLGLPRWYSLLPLIAFTAIMVVVLVWAAGERQPSYEAELAEGGPW